MLNTTSTNVSNNELISCNPNAIYGDVDHHICCLIPIYIDGGDCTACYYVDGRREIVHKSIKTVLKEVAVKFVIILSISCHLSSYLFYFIKRRRFRPHFKFNF